jgi:SAM-dependent methyltransferase
VNRDERSELAALGAQLRSAGLTARALAAWAGTARLAALPARLDAVPPSETPAGALLALLVAGAEVPRARLRGRSDAALAALIAHGLVERDAGRLRARVAILPLGGSLLVCDRLDAPAERALVCWPDDSSHHLASAIPPGRREDWLDLGCGSAFAPLARPELAQRIAGVDINPRAARHAQLGAALSGVAHLTVSVRDIGDAQPPADLVTCNAPIPDPAGADDVVDDHVAHAVLPRSGHAAPTDTGRVAEDRLHAPGTDRLAGRAALLVPEVWRRAEAGFFERLWPALQRAVRPDGLIAVHAACAALEPALADAPGERVIVRYTPDGIPGFAVAWWRPDAPARLVRWWRALTVERPHLDPRDRDDALAAAEV